MVIFLCEAFWANSFSGAFMVQIISLIVIYLFFLNWTLTYCSFEEWSISSKLWILWVLSCHVPCYPYKACRIYSVTPFVSFPKVLSILLIFSMNRLLIALIFSILSLFSLLLFSTFLKIIFFLLIFSVNFVFLVSWDRNFR